MENNKLYIDELSKKSFTKEEIIKLFSQLSFYSKLSMEDNSKIIEAFSYAFDKHEGSFRKYNETPYIYHPMNVGRDLSLLGDRDLIIAGFLHDVVRYTDTKIDEIYEKFGHDVGFMVDAISRNLSSGFFQEEKKFGKKMENGKYIGGYIEKLLYGSLKDIRCLILKLYETKDNNLPLVNLGKYKYTGNIKKKIESQVLYNTMGNIFFLVDRDLESYKKVFEKFLKKNKITDEKEFKKYLWSQIGDLLKGAEVFNDMIGGTSSLCGEDIIWTINEKEIFENIKNSKSIEDIIIRKITEEGDFFELEFVMKTKERLRMDHEEKLYKLKYNYYEKDQENVRYYY